jgi:sugar/nucleoside kinase (ribokinase family)
MYEKLNEYDVTLETLDRIDLKLDNFKRQAPLKTCFLGFDGYLDSLYSIVKSRSDAINWERMGSMREFGNLVVDIAGSSANIERVLKKKIFGGFAPNTNRALNALGVETILVAALGLPNLSQYYKPSSLVKSISIANPGETLGLEFDDGKIMITDFEPILNINRETLLKSVSKSKLIDYINKSNILGFGHWALVPQLNDIWDYFLNDLFPFVSEKKSKLFFVDIADITKRSKKDIIEMINILQKVDQEIPVMLTVNDREAIRLSHILSNVKTIKSKKEKDSDFFKGGQLINNEINLSYFVIHSPHFATISTYTDHYWITEGYTSTPKFTVAAGDHFNSGVAISISSKMTPPESILIGNALTAIFVRTGLSPDLNQLIQYVKRYMDFVLEDNPSFP